MALSHIGSHIPSQAFPVLAIKREHLSLQVDSLGPHGFYREKE